MKFLHSTYYILVILCLTMASCDTILMDEGSSSKETAETMVKLTITFPSDNVTRASRYADTSSDPNGTDGERYISDAQIYIFQNNKYVEKAQYLQIGGNNGDVTRTIEGKISKVYTTGSAEIVLLANTEKKGVNSPSLIVGKSMKEDLYKQLIYTHEGQDWKQDIPMWGVSTINNINGLYHSANITLTRAIAKVQVLVNDGQGLSNFQIKDIRVVGHNTQGYCAPINVGTPYIPIGTNFKTTMDLDLLYFFEGNYFVNKIYIPEHENLGSGSKVYLEIKALAYGKDETYQLYFKDSNNTECNVLRNHIYIFNIVSVEPKTSPVSAELTYNVEDWGNIQIDVPSFGKE